MEKFISKVKSETFWAASMENGVGNHELSQHNNRGTSNIMKIERRTRIISGSGETNETNVSDDLTKHNMTAITRKGGGDAVEEESGNAGAGAGAVKGQGGHRSSLK